MSVARECVSMTWPDFAARLRYPADAEEHFEEVHSALERKFPSAFKDLDRYGGDSYAIDGLYPGAMCWQNSTAGNPTCVPAYEAIWMTHERLGGGFRKQGGWTGRRKPLRTVFGGFVPLFIRWMELIRLISTPTNESGSVQESKLMPMVMELQHVLRPDVAYVTASVDDHGLGMLSQMLPNLVVLGVGGYAHVPLPEFNPLDGHDPLDADDAAALQAASKPFTSRPMLFSFLGSTYDDLPTEPMGPIRRQMCAQAEAAGMAPPRVNFTLCMKSPRYEEYLRNSSVTLSPRGYGRNALRHGDVLRMHNLPVAVYDDVEFVPYRELWPTFAWSTSLDALPSLIQELKGTSEGSFQARLATLRHLLPTHFTVRGVVEQMRAFSLGRGDLKCQRLPTCPQTDCDIIYAQQPYATNATTNATTLSRPRVDCTIAHVAAAYGSPPVLPLRMTAQRRRDCFGWRWGDDGSGQK